MNVNKLKSKLEGEIKRIFLAAGLTVKSSKNEINDFIKIEGFLYFCFEHGFFNDVNTLNNLLDNFHKMGRTKLDELHFKLDNLRINYYELSFGMNYKKLIDKYISKPKQIRMYDIQDNKLISLNHKLDSTLRKQYYDSLINCALNPKNTRIEHKKIEENYYFDYKGKKIKVYIEDVNLPPFNLEYGRKKKNGPLTISIDTLIKTAIEMDNIISQKQISGIDIQPQNYEKRIKKSVLKAFQNGKIIKTNNISIEKVCNILGMVGSGKSTIMQVISYYAAKNGHRLCIVFETVKEVLEMTYLFETLDIAVASVRGETTINDQIEKVIDGDEMYVSEKYAKNLTSVCILDGFIDRYDGFTNIEYGKEPCFRLMTDGKSKKYLCPFYEICPRKESSREIKNADIIITNINTFVKGHSHFIKDKGRISLLEYLISEIDIVIFDEADKLQVILDKITSESSEISQLLGDNIDPFISQVHKSIKGATNSISSEFNTEYLFATNHLNAIRNYITNNRTISSIDRIKNGKWFSGLIITNELHDKGIFSETLKEDLINYNLHNAEIELFAEYYNRYITNGDIESIEQKLLDIYELNDQQLLYLCFTLTLIYFEKSLYKLSNLIQRISEIDKDEDFEVSDIFMPPSKRLLKLIPTSPVGNLFGYIFDKGKNDITVFRQYGIGRSIMLDLPNMKLDKNGNPLGPHVLLLSGSSWAEGSQRYHINKPVNYILESDPNTIKFIENTRVTIVKSKHKVSGVFNKTKAITELIRDSRKYFESQLNREGRILVIVNSYPQCTIAQQVLQEILPNTKVFRLIPDKQKSTDNTLQRGKLNQSKNIDYDILIAPAVVIERGHNIVDNDGHSLFTSLFFIVRPMDVPRDFENIVSQLNGAIYEYSVKYGYLPIDKLSTKIKNLAFKIWDSSFKEYYSIANLPQEQKLEIVVSRLVLIMQIYGRLLRIVDITKNPPNIFFLDGSFNSDELNGFNLLKEMELYLEEQIQRHDVGEIVNMLYGPFYKALKGGNIIV